MAGLDGRRVLVTGGSSGIGRATVTACAAAGARVAAVARSTDALEALAVETGAVPLPCDLRDTDAAARAVQEAAELLGGLDAVVNNAGVMRPGPIADGRVEDWRAMLEVNVLALLAVTAAALPHLRAAPHADVVNVSSQSGRRVPNAAAGVYAGTKFAVHAVTEGLRRELVDDTIRVTVVAPGLVATDLVRGDDEASTRLRDRAAAIGLSPDDVAVEIVHVLSRPPSVHLREVVLAPSAQPT